jgi:hypothetical protein
LFQDKRTDGARPLSQRQRRQVDKAVKAAKGNPDKPQSVQNSIPYTIMYPDGLCKVTDKVYSRSIEYEDISYKLASTDGQTACFENLCDLYNYFDSTISVQETFISRKVAADEYEKAIEIPAAGDEFDEIRGEYGGILKAQLERSGGGYARSKLLTFAIEADDIKSARTRLARIEADVLAHFKRMGASARPLDGRERLSAMHSVLHLGTTDRFRFKWEWLAKTGLSTKDYIAPTSFNFGGGRTFCVGARLGCVSCLQIIAADVYDNLLSDFLEADMDTVVTMHIRSIDQSEALKMVKRKITDLDSMKITEQKRAVRSGYDMDIMPPDLATYGDEAKTLLRNLQNRNEKMFLLTLLVVNTGSNKRELENNVFQLNGIAQKHNNALQRLDYMQEQGLMSSLPLGVNDVPIVRGLTSSGMGMLIPFVTKEIFQTGEALYYGINTLSGNMIMADRKRLMNPNGLILGVPGSGKSFSAKREITNAFLITSDDIIISDPEAEYAPLVGALNGQVVKISQGSRDYLNPMDINANYSEDDDPVRLKSDFLISLCELVVGGRDGLAGDEKSLIDAAVQSVYRAYFATAALGGEPDHAAMPVLGDLYDELLKLADDNPKARRIATSLQLYVTGSLNVFNHRTNVDIENRLVCFDLKELGKQLRKLGMLIVQDQVWNRVTQNRAARRATRYYMDEMHLLLKDEQTAAYSVEIWKRFRKWGGIPTGITQNVKDLLASREVENIFENSDFVYLLAQAAGDREILGKALGISPEQMKQVTNSQPGEGLILYGGTILPFQDRFPTNTKLYRIMSTRPAEMAE